MPRSAYRLLAAASLLLAAVPRLDAARRPRYGGTLRMEVRAARALEVGEWPMVFETLVRLDESGRVQPALAISWRHDASGQRWQFRLRPNMKFHDGSPLAGEAVAAALGANGWTCGTAGPEVVVQTGAPVAVAEFADARRAVFVRGSDGSLQGTGPFRLAQWESRRATLAANEDYWAGRPFLDAVAIEMGRTAQQQLLNLELGKADLIELGPNDVRRAVQSGARIWTSAPVTLMALRFERGRPAAEDAKLREALALSIDRAAILNVLLQRRGEAAGGLLPQWLSGYAMLFSAARDAARARQLVTGAPLLSLASDPADALARTIADRIAVNTREAGIRLLTQAGGNADLYLVRARIAPPVAGPALARLAASLEVSDLFHVSGPGLESLYAGERALVEEFRVIPLFHLPEIYGASPRLKTWATPGLARTGEWRLDDLWLDSELP
ncbi:MAG: ABC transporter substrate-binding protein [Bryobacteraceae bacterium]